jgi:hypothetical protein
VVSFAYWDQILSGPKCLLYLIYSSIGWYSPAEVSDAILNGSYHYKASSKMIRRIKNCRPSRLKCLNRIGKSQELDKKRPKIFFIVLLNFSKVQWSLRTNLEEFEVAPPILPLAHVWFPHGSRKRTMLWSMASTMALPVSDL